MTGSEGGKDTRWKPGESGNPAGRPVGSRNGLRARLRHMLKTQAPEDAIAELRAQGIEIEEGTIAEVIAGQLVKMALDGSLKAISEIIRITEPPLPRAIELTGMDGGPIETEASSPSLEDRLMQYAGPMERIRAKLRAGNGTAPVAQRDRTLAL